MYNPSTGQGAMTDRFIADRGAMLTWGLRFEQLGARDDNDDPRAEPKPFNEDWDTERQSANDSVWLLQA